MAMRATPSAWIFARSISFSTIARAPSLLCVRLFLAMFVRKNVGHRTVTPTPCGRSSDASVSDRATTPAFNVVRTHVSCGQQTRGGCDVDDVTAPLLFEPRGKHVAAVDHAPQV